MNSGGKTAFDAEKETVPLKVRPSDHRLTTCEGIGDSHDFERNTLFR